MNVSKITEVTIYESPDGGRTVYARRPGSKTRELHMQDPELTKELAEIERQKRWQEIFEARHTNEGLNDMCEKIEMFYALLNTTPVDKDR